MSWLARLFARRAAPTGGAWNGPGTLAVLDRTDGAIRDAGRADWYAIPAPGFTFAPAALPAIAAAIAADPTIDVLFGDETDDRGHWHKPGWSSALLLAQPYLDGLFVVRGDLLRDVGGPRPDAGEAARYDLALRATAAARRVAHLPVVLGHVPRAARPGAAHAAAAQRAAATAGLDATVTKCPHADVLRVAVRPKQRAAITVVVPTRDRLELLRPCIESVRATITDLDVRILIVDNGSADPATLAWFAELRADARITVLRDDGPFDYSALMNRAIEATTTPLVLLLNNDTKVISPDWLHQLSGWLELADVAAVGAKLYYGNDTIQHAGVLVGVGGVASHGHKQFARDAAGYRGLLHSVRDVSASTGACLLVRRDAYLAVGGMASELRVAYNDVDLCLRLRARGRRIVWTPLAELYHFEGQSRGTDKVRTARFEREIAYMRERWPSELAADPFHNPNLSDRHVDYRRRQPAG